MKKHYFGLFLGLSIVAVACTGQVAEQNHPCPCGAQWTCCAGGNLCVPKGSACLATDGGSTSTLDASSPPTLDAGPTPTPILDATPSMGIVTLDSGVGGLCVLPLGGAASDAQAADSCYCTRRPGPGVNAHFCPAGIGEYSQAAVGSPGGTLTLKGRAYAASGVAAEIDFPPTAIATPTDVKLIETNIPPPQDLLDWSPVYLIEPAGLSLAVPASIQFPWSSGPISSTPGTPTEVTAGGLSIWFSADGTCFTRVSDSYTNAGFEQGSTTQLGYFIVGSPRTAATAMCP